MNKALFGSLLLLISVYAILPPFDMLTIVGKATDFNASYIDEYNTNWDKIQENYTWGRYQAIEEPIEEKNILESLYDFVLNLFEGFL